MTTRAVLNLHVTFVDQTFYFFQYVTFRGRVKSLPEKDPGSPAFRGRLARNNGTTVSQ